MDTTQKEALAEIKELLHGIAGSLHGLGDLLRMLAERQEEMVKLLTPEPKDGPSLDELLATSSGN